MALPPDINPNSIIPASWLNQVKNEILQSILGDGLVRTHRAGQNLTIKVDEADLVRASPIRRFRVKSTTTDWLVCRLWDGTTEGGNDIKVARAFPDRIDYPVDRVIYATQPTGGTGITDGEGAPVTWLDARLTVGQLFPVLVANDGGADGDDENPATWTYSVWTLDQVQIGSEIEVVRPRANGSMTPQGALFENQYGVAFYNRSGELCLWDAGEIPVTVPECE